MADLSQRAIQILIKFGVNQADIKRVQNGTLKIDDAIAKVGETTRATNRLYKRLASEAEKSARRQEKAFKETGEEAEKAGKRIKEALSAGAAGGFVAGFVDQALDAGIEALRQSIDVAVEAQISQQNLAFSIQAAQKEFSNVGSIQSWQQNIEDLSEQLATFGNQDVDAATTRLIDMTKRLGLTESEMKTVLSRTADLSAGKVDLADGVELVTKARQGEGRAAGSLGVLLDEAVVMK